LSDLHGVDVGKLLGLLVHDLRNPAATFGANIEFLQDTDVDDTDAREALEDLGLALDDVKRGLELMSYIGRWLMGEPASVGSDGDLAVSLPTLIEAFTDFAVELDLPADTALRVANASAIVEIVCIFLANAKHHARHAGAVLRARMEAEHVVVECEDHGPALPVELRSAALTLAGQGAIKARPNGRYAQFAGLLAAHALAESADARVECDGEDGAAVFRVIARRA